MICGIAFAVVTTSAASGVNEENAGWPAFKQKLILLIANSNNLPTTTTTRHYYNGIKKCVMIALKQRMFEKNKAREKIEVGLYSLLCKPVYYAGNSYRHSALPYLPPVLNKVCQKLCPQWQRRERVSCSLLFSLNQCCHCSICIQYFHTFNFLVIIFHNVKAQI